MLQGIVYFASHRFLWPLLKARIIPCLILSTATFTILFIWAYLPQAVLLLPIHGRAAFFNAFILVLGEGATLTALFFEAFFVDATLANIFDAVLIAYGCTSLVARGREVHSAVPDTPGSTRFSDPPSEPLNPVQRLGNTYFSPIYSPFSITQICEFILLLPLNLVPYVGVPCFLLLTGARGGPLHHHRYFRLRNLKKKERRAEVSVRSLRYTWFGTSALLLQLVPGLNMLFLMTTAAGSALWVADLERERSGGEGGPRSEEYRDGIAGRGDRGYDTFERGPILEEIPPS
jgi:Etoposide-induced protein 2.4 (EI24)